MEWTTNPITDYKKEMTKVYELQKLIERIQRILQSHSDNYPLKHVREEIQAEINKAFNLFK